eukprot:IDg6217t1
MGRIALSSIYITLLISSCLVFAEDICSSCPLPQAPEKNCALIPYVPTEGIIAGLSAYNYGNYDRNGPSDWPNLDCTTDSAKVYYGIQPQNYKLTCAKGWCGSANYSGETYRLLQSHLHSPSEHTINGKHYSLELHLVHVNEDDKRCMGSIDLSSLTGMAKQRWTLVSYLGSLTNPPCRESVRFAVSRSVQKASKQQIARFVRQVGGKANNRPTQDLNGRVFFSFS